MILGIDMGTSSMKVQVLDDKKKIYTFRGKYVGEGIDCFYETFRMILGQVSRYVSLKSINAIGLSSQSCTYILYDGTSQSPWFGWSNPGGAGYVEEAKKHFQKEEFQKWISMPCPRMHSYPIPRILWFQKEYREQWRKMYKLLQPKDYLYYQLTGIFATDPYLWRGLSNIENACFETGLLNRLQMERGKLPEIFSSFEAPGKIEGRKSQELGLNPGVPVYLGCNDYFASLLGMGITQVGQCFDITGTSEHVGGISAEISEEEKLISGPYFTGNVVYGVTGNSGKSLKWAAETFCTDKGETQWKQERIQIESMREKKPPIYLPYLEGERAPIWNPKASAAFVGVRSHHSRTEFLYSVSEGVVFSLKHIYDLVPLESHGAMKVSGGAAQNLELNRMKAALFGRPLQILKEKDTSALGAVICAAIGEGRYADPKEAADDLCSVAYEVEPEGELTEYLQPRFEQYLRLVAALESYWEN